MAAEVSLEIWCLDGKWSLEVWEDLAAHIAKSIGAGFKCSPELKAPDSGWCMLKYGTCWEPETIQAAIESWLAVTYAAKKSYSPPVSTLAWEWSADGPEQRYYYLTGFPQGYGEMGSVDYQKPQTVTLPIALRTARRQGGEG